MVAPTPTITLLARAATTNYNLGPLTTAWSAPSNCLNPVGVTNVLAAGWAGQMCGSKGPIDDDNCWPPTSSGAVPFATAAPFAGRGFYSPGVQCPTGYVSACTQVGTTSSNFAFQFPPAARETAVGCCPSGYTCAMSSSHQTCQRVISTSTSILIGACPSSGADISYVYQAIPLATETAYTELAPMIQIKHQLSDLAAAPAATSLDMTLSSSPSTETAASIDTTTTTNATSGMSSVAKISIGAGSGAAVFLVALVAFLFYRRRRQTQQRGKRIAEIKHISNPYIPPSPLTPVSLRGPKPPRPPRPATMILSPMSPYDLMNPPNSATVMMAPGHSRQISAESNSSTASYHSSDHLLPPNSATMMMEVPGSSSGHTRNLSASSTASKETYRSAQYYPVYMYNDATVASSHYAEVDGGAHTMASSHYPEMEGDIPLPPASAYPEVTPKQAMNALYEQVYGHAPPPSELGTSTWQSDLSRFTEAQDHLQVMGPDPASLTLGSTYTLDQENHLRTMDSETLGVAAYTRAHHEHQDLAASTLGSSYTIDEEHSLHQSIYNLYDRRPSDQSEDIPLPPPAARNQSRPQ